MERQPEGPEHLTSDEIKRPVVWHEDNKIRIDQETWDRLVAKYGEEKVSRYYRIRPNG